MKVIFFTKYTRKGASSRLRTYQYIDFFKSQDIECIVSPFFSDPYLDEVYRTRKHNKMQALLSLIRRAFVLMTIFRYDRVVVEKEVVPFFPAVFEWMLYVLGVQYIVDYDDAIFHNYDIHPNRMVRSLLGSKIGKVMRYASVVVAGNDYIREYAERHGARNVIVIPTVIDLKKYTVRDYESTAQLFTIGWIGSPITAKYLPTLRPVLTSLSLRYKLRIMIVGANAPIGIPSAEEELIRWREEEEISCIRCFDVGIMPLEDNIWERGKCGYKLIQYMGCGIPVVGTPIGVNESIIESGKNGFQAAGLKEWEHHLEFLITHPEERKKMGLYGRAFVEEKFSLQIFQVRWLEILRGNPL